jgi:hypothetical protein
LVVAEATFFPQALVTVTVPLRVSPEVLTWFCAKRVLPVRVLLRLTRASSALEKPSTLAAMASASARVKKRLSAML